MFEFLDRHMVFREGLSQLLAAADERVLVFVNLGELVDQLPDLWVVFEAELVGGVTHSAA